MTLIAKMFDIDFIYSDIIVYNILDVFDCRNANIF